MPTAIDIESDARYSAPQPIVSVAIASDRGAHIFVAHDPYLEDVVHHVFEDGAIFANAPNDVMMIASKFPRLWPTIIAAYNRRGVHDVLTREKKIDIAEGYFRFRGGYDLAAVTRRRAGLELVKDDVRLRYHEVIGLELAQWPEEFRRYAMNDPIATYADWLEQERFRAQHTADVFACSQVEACAHLALFRQQLIGIPVDRAWTSALDRDIGVEIRRLETLLVHHGLARVGGTKAKPKIVKSEKAAREMMLATGSGKMTKPTDANPKGQVKIDAETVREALLPANHPLRIYGDLATLQSTTTKNMGPLAGFDRVFTKYDECVSTGRTSSSAPDDRDDGTNWQNLPRPPEHKGRDHVRDLMGRFRGCLVPPPGYAFGISDLSGVELGTFADTEVCWFGDSKMGDALNAGKKPHAMFASVLLGISEDQLDRKNVPEHQAMYQVSKINNFGRLGAMGDEKFRRNLFSKFDILQDIQTTRAHGRAWKQLWGTDRYFKHIDSLADHQGFITIVEPRTGFIRGRMRYNEACNFPFQSKAAYAAKLGLWWLFLASMDPKSILYGTWQCIFVHDENVSCFPLAIAEQCLAEQNRIMTAACRAVCPAVAIGVEGHLEERYGK